MTEQDVPMSDPDGSRAESGERLRSAGEQASAAVRQAAAILESELSGGIDEARRLQQRFTERRRLEPGDLDEVAERVRRSTHDLIDMLSERFHDLGAQDVQDLASRFGKDAHAVLDGVMDLVDAAPGVVNRLMEKSDARGGGPGRSRDGGAPDDSAPANQI
jgi:hypothetical protein